MVTAMHSELTTNDGEIVAWTPIGPVAGERCGQFLQKLGLEKESILTAATAHTTVFAAAQAQPFNCRVMVVAACKLSGRDEEAALKALAEMHEGVLETHTAAHLKNGEESTWWNAEGTTPGQHALWNAEGAAPGQTLWNAEGTAPGQNMHAPWNAEVTAPGQPPHAEAGLKYSATQQPEDTTPHFSTDRQPTREVRLISKIGTSQQHPLVDLLADPR